MVRVEFSAYKPPPLPVSDAVHSLIMSSSMLRVEPVTNKPPPAPALHPLIVLSVMVMVKEFFAYKPPPHLPSHPLIVPLLMLMAELSAYKPPPSLYACALHLLIVPPPMLMVD